MEAKTHVLFHTLTHINKEHGVIFIPCDLERFAISRMDDGAPVVFVPRLAGLTLADLYDAVRRVAPVDIADAG